MEQITTYGTIKTISQFEDKTEITARFNRIVKKTNEFNGRLIKTEIVKHANGKTFNSYNAKTGKKIREVSLLTYRHGTELTYQDYI